mgnify:CR=1 FL=1
MRQFDLKISFENFIQKFLSKISFKNFIQNFNSKISSDNLIWKFYSKISSDNLIWKFHSKISFKNSFKIRPIFQSFFFQAKLKISTVTGEQNDNKCCKNIRLSTPSYHADTMLQQLAGSYRYNEELSTGSNEYYTTSQAELQKWHIQHIFNFINIIKW